MTDLNAESRGPGRNLWVMVIVGAIVAVCLLAAWMAADAWIHPPGP